jgi:hypothetical protein
MVKIPPLYELTQWICYAILLAGLAIVWVNFWIGVFYCTFGFGVLYLIVRREDKNYKFMQMMSRRNNERTQGVG